MGKLYEAMKAHTIEREDAAEMANIAGKFLKAEQLILAREIFEHQMGNRAAGSPAALPPAGENFDTVKALTAQAS